MTTRYQTTTNLSTYNFMDVPKTAIANGETEIERAFIPLATRGAGKVQVGVM
jgi:hypothetical protein